MFIRSGTHYEEGSTTTGTHWWLYKGTSIDRYELGAIYAYDHGPGATFAKPPTVEKHGSNRMLIKQEFGVNEGEAPIRSHPRPLSSDYGMFSSGYIAEPRS